MTSSKKLLTGTLFAFILAVRTFLIYLIATDSDELKWSLMAKRIAAGQEFYLFFLEQDYRGALEAYLIAPWQAVFGYHLWTLRITSIMFVLLTSAFLYWFLKKRTSPLIAALAVSVYSLAPPATNIALTKSFGNYPFLQLLCLLLIYLAHRLTRYPLLVTSYLPPLLLGLGLGIGFWANMHIVYIFPVIGFIYLLYFLKHIPKTTDQKPEILSSKLQTSPKFECSNTRNITSYGLLVTSYAFILLLFLYAFAKHKIYYNPALTLTTKFGLTGEWLSLLDFPITPISLLLVLILITPLYLRFIKPRNPAIRAAFLTLEGLLIGIIPNVYRYSLVRVGDTTPAENLQVLKTTLFPLLLGYNPTRPLPLLILSLPILYGLIKLAQHSLRSDLALPAPPNLPAQVGPTLPGKGGRTFSTCEVDRSDLSCSLASRPLITYTYFDSMALLFLAVPLVFILSSTKVPATPRHVIVLWPAYILLLAQLLGWLMTTPKRSGFGSDLLPAKGGPILPLQSANRRMERAAKRGLIGASLAFLALLWIPQYQRDLTLYATWQGPAQRQEYQELIALLDEHQITACHGEYWNGFPITYFSQYRIPCVPSRIYGWQGGLKTNYWETHFQRQERIAYIFKTEEERLYFEEQYLTEPAEVIKLDSTIGDSLLLAPYLPH